VGCTLHCRVRDERHDVQIQEAEDYMAEAEVQAAQKRMQAAELEVESANAAQGKLAAAARKASLKVHRTAQSPPASTSPACTLYAGA
jgi:hypothetical protein